MGHCLWCGSKGIFLRVDKNNLCHPCQEKIYPDIKNKIAYILYCYKRLKESQKFHVKTAHLELLLKTKEELKKYEDKNIPTMNTTLDLTDVFSNVKGPIFKITIDRNKEALEKKAIEELKRVANEYSIKYGRLPGGYLSIESYGDQRKYFIELMDKYEKEGILPLNKIEECIKNSKPFKGVHSLGILEDDGYKIFVADTLIYDGKNFYFDFQFKRFSMYSEIQHMVAKNILKKDLALIREEARKADKRNSRKP